MDHQYAQRRGYQWRVVQPVAAFLLLCIKIHRRRRVGYTALALRQMRSIRHRKGYPGFPLARPFLAMATKNTASSVLSYCLRRLTRNTRASLRRAKVEVCCLSIFTSFSMMHAPINSANISSIHPNTSGLTPAGCISSWASLRWQGVDAHCVPRQSQHLQKVVVDREQKDVNTGVLPLKANLASTVLPVHGPLRHLPAL